MILQLAPSYPAFVPLVRARRGMGDAYTDADQVASLGGALATSTIGILASGATPMIAATTASIAIPAIGIGVAAVVIALALIKNSGCGQTCIIAANDANKVEPLLQANLQGYFAGPRTAESRATALANFDTITGWLLDACANSALGNAGKRCISDRQAGACVWKQTAAGAASYPGVPAEGQCWNWWNGYRDPIASDSGVASQPMGVQSSIPLLGGINLTDLLIPAALLAVIWWVS